MISNGTTLQGWKSPTQIHPVDVKKWLVRLVAIDETTNQVRIGTLTLDGDFDGSLSGADLDAVIGTTGRTVAAIVTFLDRTETDPADGAVHAHRERGRAAGRLDDARASERGAGSVEDPAPRRSAAGIIRFDARLEPMPRWHIGEARRPTLAMRYADVLDAIGDTPLVGLPSDEPDRRRAAVGQARGPEPDRLDKDRIAKPMVEAAEASGELIPDKTILEPTSGNTGIALAMVARRKGYPLTVVIPDNASEERIRLLELFGAEIVFSPGDKGTNGSIEVATRPRRGTTATTCRSSTGTRRTRWRTRRGPARRSSATCPRSRTSSPGWGRAAPSPAWAGDCTVTTRT